MASREREPMKEQQWQQCKGLGGPRQQDGDMTAGTISGNICILGLHEPLINKGLRNLGLEETLKLI